MASPPDPAVLRRIGWAVAVVAVAALLVVGFSAMQRASTERAVAVREAQTYRPPSASPSAVAAIVSVIGDGLTAGTAAGSGTGAPWPALTGKRLDARLAVLAEPDMGYVQGAGQDGTTTFVDYATTVFPQSKVVVFLGGGADAGSNPDVLENAARTAFATAKAQAPDATVVVVAPPWSTGSPPAEVVEVAARLKDAARRERVEFVDPVAAGWFTGARGAFVLNGTALSDSGQRVLSEHMTALIRPYL